MKLVVGMPAGVHDPPGGAHKKLAVRIRPTQSCRSIRDRLRRIGLAPRVVDCSVVLDEGAALDVPDIVDGVRLARVAARLRGVGYPVVAIVYRGLQEPATTGFMALRATQLAGHRWSTLPPPAPAVHSRMDALVAAGGEAYEFSVAEQPGWEPGLGAINSHVHAKLMCVDSKVCAVGSANLDITAGYWESELMLVIEDAEIAAATEARVAHLVAGSLRVDRNDPRWRAMARQREWMRHWPGVLSV